MILHKLKREAETSGSFAALARRIGISGAYLSDIMSGKRNAGPKVLNYLGLNKRVSYEKR